MVDVNNLPCQTCNNVRFVCFEGFYYCSRCGKQNDDIFDTADDVPLETAGGFARHMGYQRRQRPDAIKVETIYHYCSFYEPQSNDLIRKLGLEDETPQNVGVKNESTDTYMFDGTNPSNPEDFGGSRVVSYEDYQNEIRMRYVMGLQIMIELQCEALVKEFKVTPLICGLVGPIWLRFVSNTGVFDEDWADQEIHDSELRKEGHGEPGDYKTRGKHRAVVIWLRSLKERIPLASTVAVSYLACHIAREAILPSDLMKWTLEGKLPYVSAFLEIERRMGYPSIACPISSSDMFRPQRPVPVRKLESFAAFIAQLIGLELPPVNFYAIAYRYLEKLSLPVETILPYACRIYEWSTPPDLWLSFSTDSLPTHVCVVSILVVAIRMLYDINGYGDWEKSLSRKDGAKDNNEMDTTYASHGGHGSGDSAKDPVGPQKHKLDSARLLQHLQAIYNDTADSHDYSKDLPTYLKYCRDFVFDGLEPSYGNHEEEKVIEILWNFFESEENTKSSEPAEHSNTSNEEKRRECFNEPSPANETYLTDDLPGSLGNDNSSESSSDNEDSDSNDETYLIDDSPESLGNVNSSESSSNKEDSDSNEHVVEKKPVVNEVVRQMKLDMKENRFYYIPPSVKPKLTSYVHYSRKKDGGALTYVAHADYYILLRACARIAQVDIRTLHIGVLSLERRLAWLEKRINQCLHLKPTNISCQFCSVRAIENVYT